MRGHHADDALEDAIGTFTTWIGGHVIEYRQKGRGCQSVPQTPLKNHQISFFTNVRIWVDTQRVVVVVLGKIV